MQKSEVALDNANRQVASGQLSDTYAGYGDKTAVMEAARSAAEHADANLAGAQQASTRLDLQNTQLSELSSLASQVRQTLTQASANQDATSLMSQMQGYFNQAMQILNAKDADGYIFGGDNNQVPPVTVNSLSDLAALPSVSGAFQNGQVTSSVRIGDNQSVQVGMLASNIGSQLFSLFQQVAQFDSGAGGPFDAKTTASQQSFHESTVQTASAVTANVNAQSADNGIRYQTVQKAMDQLQANATVYKGFVSNIQDVDMAQALSKVNQSQVALQASFQVASTLNQLSLLNYLPTG
jgi:flagellar hook-associated protein 3 FlgL